MKSEITPEFKVSWCITKFYFGSSLMKCLLPLFFFSFPQQIICSPLSTTRQLHPSSCLRDAQTSCYEIWNYTWIQSVLVYHKVLFWVFFNDMSFFNLFPNRLFVAHSLQPDSFTHAHVSEMHKLAAMKSEITPEFKVFWCTTRFYFGSSLMTCLFLIFSPPDYL